MGPLDTSTSRRRGEIIPHVERFAQRVLTPAEVVAELTALAPELRRLGARRLVFLGFEPPWEWTLDLALVLAVTVSPEEWAVECAVQFRIEDHFGREVHIVSATPEVANGDEPVEIHGLD